MPDNHDSAYMAFYTTCKVQGFTQVQFPTKSYTPYDMQLLLQFATNM